MTLLSDKWQKSCKRCGHTQYVHAGPGHTGECRAYLHKHVPGTKECKAFV